MGMIRVPKSFLSRLYDPILAYRLRWKRRRLLFRCWHRRRQLCRAVFRADNLKKNEIRAFVCLRNEVDRLPFWLDHYRRLGVGHFFCVVNDSSDGSLEFLLRQPDCSVWTTTDSYKNARFGMDWLGCLLWRYRHGAWCVVVPMNYWFIRTGMFVICTN